MGSLVVVERLPLGESVGEGQIPDWFHHLRADAAADYRQARQALDDSNATRTQLVAAYDVAAQRTAAANTRCVPFDAEFNAATDAVKRDETAQRAAQQRLDQSISIIRACSISTSAPT